MQRGFFEKGDERQTEEKFYRVYDRVFRDILVEEERC
jgi:hypothetical protein